MKALVKKLPERGLWLMDVPEPTVGPNEVKIKIHKTAICGTDLHIYNWDEWSHTSLHRDNPRALRHSPSCAAALRSNRCQ